MIARIRIFYCTVTALTAWSATASDSTFRIQPVAGKILDQYCISCHDDGTKEGDVRLDNLGALPLEAHLDLMNRMLEQVYLKQMPPPKKKTQPTAAYPLTPRGRSPF